jgi:hypothetical protein
MAIELPFSVVKSRDNSTTFGRWHYHTRDLQMVDGFAERCSWWREVVGFEVLGGCFE